MGFMRIEPENNGVSIVLVGSLNAAIFHPSWFVANDLLKKDDIVNVEVELINKNFAIFKVGNWLRIQVEPNRFIADTSEPPFIRLHDLVVRTFREVLNQTPIFQMGINRRVHFNVGDEETRNKIGKMLAPQEAWGEWANNIKGSKDKKHGGMTSLSMMESDLDDREIGQIIAQVAPSQLIKNHAGIFMNINDHYEIPKDDSLAGSTKIMDILERQYELSIKRSEWIIDQIMALKEKV
jgi:hypothetical protein